MMIGMCMRLTVSSSSSSSRQRLFYSTTILRNVLHAKPQRQLQYVSFGSRGCSDRQKSTYPSWTGNFQVAANIPWMASSPSSSSSATNTNNATTPMATTSSVITPIASYSDPHFTTHIDDVVIVENGMKNTKHFLPKTWKEVLRMQTATKHAIVITTSHEPHTIVHVNDAWMELCGYTMDESMNRTFKDLLHGPDTNHEHASSIARKVFDTNTCQDAYLVNYTKEGRRFYNHLSIGPLYFEQSDMMMKHIVDEEKKDIDSKKNDHQKQHQQNPLFMVGILREVKREQIPLRCIA